MKAHATDQASLDYLKYSEFQTVIDLAGMAFRIDGNRYTVFVEGENGEEVTIFEGTRAAVLDFLEKSDASLRGCTENARQQVFGIEEERA